MNDQGNRQSQNMLLLRCLCGGYLVYLAWDLRQLIRDSAVFMAAVLVFGLAGGALLIHSLVTLLRPGWFRKDPPTETTEECEERSDD